MKYNRANADLDEGKYSASVEQYREVLDEQREVLGIDHPDTSRTMNNLSFALVRLGRFAEARDVAEEALFELRRSIGPDASDTLNTQDTLAIALEGLGQLKEARRLREEVLELSAESHPSRRDFLRGLALNVALNVDSDQAERHRAIELADEAVRLDTNDSESWRVLGVVRSADGQWDTALEAFERAAELGYDDELVPASILERMHESRDLNDDVYDQLIQFLEKRALTSADGVASESR